MIYIQDKIMKVGGITIPGQFKSIEISHAAKIDEVEDESGNTREQPTGYEDAKISIDMILEETSKKTVTEQIEEIQKLFKSKDQKKAKVYQIVSSDTAARNIFKVYFKSLTHKNTLTLSYTTATLEFIEYNPYIISTEKTSTSSSTSSSSSSSTSSSKYLTKDYSDYVKTSRGTAPKTSKTTKTTATDNQSTTKKVADTRSKLYVKYDSYYALN